MPKANWTAVIATIGCTIIFGVFGVLLALTVDRQDWAVLWFFWTLPLLLIAFTIWELTVNVARRKQHKLREIRSAFDRSFSHEQTFAFDQHGWTHDSDNTRQEVAWNALSTMSEWQNVITLSAKGYAAVVPKRALDTDQLQLLRVSALRDLGPKFFFSSSFWNWSKTNLFHFWKHNFVVMILVHLAGIVGLVMMLRRLGNPSNPTDFFWGELLCVLVLFLGVTAQFWYLPLGYANLDDSQKAGVEAQISDHGLWFRKPFVTFFRSWTTFRKAEESRSCFLLYYDEYQSFILQKTNLTLEQVNEFRKLIQIHLVNAQA